jgi:hypothetical protein
MEGETVLSCSETARTEIAVAVGIKDTAPTQPPSLHPKLQNYIAHDHGRIDQHFMYCAVTNCKTKQTAWPLVRKRSIPTERPQLVDEI